MGLGGNPIVVAFGDGRCQEMLAELVNFPNRALVHEFSAKLIPVLWH